jgi:hypothetical protein
LLPLLRDIGTSSAEALDLVLYPAGSAERQLADGTRLLLESAGARVHIRVEGPDRAYALSAGHGTLGRVARASRSLVDKEKLRWRGDIDLELTLQSA